MMTSYESTSTIDNLPDKVLGEIFDYLDLDEVKNASLVCRRWNRIIFHSPFIERFCLMLHDGPIKHRERDMLETIESRFTHSSTRKQKVIKRKVQQQIRGQLFKEVLQSQRCYRKVDYHFCYNFVLQAMPPQKLQHIQDLRLHLDARNFASLDLWITFANAIPLMKHLNTLYLDTIEDECDFFYEYKIGFYCEYNIALIVQSNSVRHLIVGVGFPITADMPALETYIGPIEPLHRLGPNMPRNQCEKMQKLDLRYTRTTPNYTINDFRECFRRFPNIKTIIIRDYERDFYTAMCETCISLQELEYKIGYRSDLNLLTNLTSLRRISIYGNNAPATASLDFSKLSKLEHLDLGTLSVKRSFIHNLPHSIVKLDLYITPQNERSLMRAITSSMTRLRKLKIRLYNPSNGFHQVPAIVTLRLLPLLIRLEMLEFEGGLFDEFCLLNMQTPMQRLRELRFADSLLDTTHFKGLHEKFPKLKKLEFQCKLKSNDWISCEYQF